jgi:hypothetical protein
MFRRVAMALFLTVVVTGEGSADVLRVLFVGNSLTYTNELPRVVEALARGGDVEIEAGMVAFANAALEDHWADGRARREIASKRWDIVVMQQGPSSLASSRADLVEWTSKFAGEIRAAGARPALLGVWPAARNRAMLGNVIESYRIAAGNCDCELLPAGLAWQSAWKKSGRLSLYGADGFHPSDEGTYLAALVIWGGLTGADLSGAPAELRLPEGRRVTIRRSRAMIYREVAAAALSSRWSE